MQAKVLGNIRVQGFPDRKFISTKTRGAPTLYFGALLTG